MIITFEGTDCSGKETQSNILTENLKKAGKTVKKFYFPYYESPTGKIIAGPYLGKFGQSYFEDPTKVDPIVASLYYAADRKYNIEDIEKATKEYDYVIIDRYVYSNMAHQGCKIPTNKQKQFFKFIYQLEFEMLNLPKPDLVIFLYLNSDTVQKLLANRKEKKDAHESNREYLKNAENTYLNLSRLYNFQKVDCEKNGVLLSKEIIGEKVLKIVKDYERKYKK